MSAPGPDRAALSRELETDGFILRPLNYFEAFRFTAPMRKDVDVLAALFHSRKPQSLRKWMRSPLLPRRKVRFSYLVIAKATGKPIGIHMVGLSGHKSAYFAVALHDRDWWGKGAVIETRTKLMNHFIRHADVERFFGMVDGRNLSSIFNYQRLGFTHTGSWHRHNRDPVTGEVSDVVMFELFREQWQAGPLAETTDEH